MTTFDVSDLRALFINCTLKPTPEVSNTQRLMDNAIAIMRSNGVAIDEVRAVDHEIPPGGGRRRSAPPASTPARRPGRKPSPRPRQRSARGDRRCFGRSRRLPVPGVVALRRR